ncbi:hypothetical protein CJB66_05955 [Campylobacter jejuni]|nr:hypothetical protein [Campylobacter jejuni]EGS8444020.1 hypothetical protein [Campylobacter jejuni]
MKEKFLAFLSILPFFIVFTFFMIAPLIWIVFNAFYVEEDEIYSLANFIHIFESKFYCRRKNKISIWKNKTSIKVEILFFYKP